MSQPGVDLQQVLREIDEEVDARRAAGDFPPGMERDLDLVFARFAPATTSGDRVLPHAIPSTTTAPMGTRVVHEGVREGIFALTLTPIPQKRKPKLSAGPLIVTSFTTLSDS